jgi:RNA polymerase sigma-70 factor (TIGR02957 family)
VTRHGDAPVDEFVRHRPLLFTVAYEMLGSAADAEDVLQETWLRWAPVEKAGVRDPRAYLVRIVTRQALNHLRTARRQREEYVGPWLPEPLATTPDVAEDVELADAVSFAMLVVLETLSPLERAVYVLREVFGFEYAEVAEATGRRAAAVRQIAHRAREHVRARRPRAVIDDRTHSEVAERFAKAAQSGDVQQLMDVLAPDVVLLSDGGGRAKAALRPVRGAEKVARFLLGVTPSPEHLRVEWASVNGAPAALVYLEGRLDTVTSVDTDSGRITRIYLVRNPEKLAAVAERRSLAR